MEGTQMIDQVLDRMTEHAEAIRNDAERVYESRDIGDAHPQGDILITRIKSLPKGAVKIKATVQLAPGTTQGSRHTLRSVGGVTMYRVADPGPFDGPILVHGGCAIDHPEHGNVVLPAGIDTITYQRADLARRVQD